MPDEELFIGGYIIRRQDEEHFEIENSITGESMYRVPENSLAELINELWKELEG